MTTKTTTVKAGTRIEVTSKSQWSDGPKATPQWDRAVVRGVVTEVKNDGFAEWKMTEVVSVDQRCPGMKPNALIATGGCFLISAMNVVGIKVI